MVCSVRVSASSYFSPSATQLAHQFETGQRDTVRGQLAKPASSADVTLSKPGSSADPTLSVVRASPARLSLAVSLTVPEASVFLLGAGEASDRPRARAVCSSLPAATLVSPSR